MDLKKAAYDKVNKEALWKVLRRMYYVNDKLLNWIKSMYINSLACVRIKECESERFKIESCMRQGCIMSPWLFNVYMDAVIKEVKMEMGVRFLKEGRLPGLLFVDDLVLCGKSEQDLKVILALFDEVCRRGLKVNADKSNVMALGREEGLECEIRYVSEFKYVRCGRGEVEDLNGCLYVYD